MKQLDFDLTSPLQLPTKDVHRYVEFLAQAFNVEYARMGADAMAEIVTRLAGDEVHVDNTCDLLGALKRAKKLSDREMAALLCNHQREIRGL